MIRVNLPNIITVSLAGALGYALIVGIQKLRSQLTGAQPMDKVINWELISNPFNWIIVLVMLYFAALLAHMVHSATAGAPFAFPSIDGI